MSQTNSPANDAHADDPLQLCSPPFFTLLGEDTQNTIKKSASLMHYSDGQLIHSRGADKPGLSVIESGRVFAGVTDSEGKQLIVGMLGPGHCFGEFTLFTDLVRTHDITAVGETRIWQLSDTAFMTLFQQHSDIAKALLECTLYRLHTVLESMDAIRRLPALERTAKLLLLISYTSDMRDNIPVRQQELANTAGVSRVSMGKALKQLESLGLISLGYRAIHLPDRTHLAAWLLNRSSDTRLKR